MGGGGSFLYTEWLSWGEGFVPFVMMSERSGIWYSYSMETIIFETIYDLLLDRDSNAKCVWCILWIRLALGPEQCVSRNPPANEATGQNLPTNEATGHPLVNVNKRKKNNGIQKKQTITVVFMLWR